MDVKTFSRPADLARIKITDAFWKQKAELVRDAVIPYQWEALNDRVPGAQPSYCVHNFKAAGRINQRREREADYIQPVYSVGEFTAWPEAQALDERFYGFLFQDSDFYKWLEAAAYSLRQFPSPELERIVDEAVDIVCEAQQPDGYLDTFYIINDISRRFTNLKDNHELYCFGHLTEAAVAYYQATGKERLLKTACRFADCIAERFGTEEGKLRGYPGHEIAEMALARLYEATGEEKYLKLGLYFINERGQQPYYYDTERAARGESITEGEGLRYQYNQAHLPVREQTEAVGHAVRAAYLYAGMADFARLTGDDSLKAACVRLWDDATRRKMYITGGFGGTHMGEAFSFAYDLPNDTAYSETCAAIGMVFFARRMLEMDADSRYADVMERALYNTVLAGMGLDGESFFYVNPLEVNPEACRADERKAHVKPARQKWFGCACCPPNLARLLSSVGAYALTEADNTLYVHLYAGCRYVKQTGRGEAVVNIESGFPWDGNVKIHIKNSGDGPLTLALRIPGWCDNYGVSGVDGARTRVDKGYLYITKQWKSDTILLDFPMEPRVMEADGRVRETVGQATVMRGPVVYCLEEADNGKNLHLIKLDKFPSFQTETRRIAGETLTALKSNGWKQIETESGELYKKHEETRFEKAELIWLPYYAWANRGEGEMRVWVRE